MTEPMSGHIVVLGLGRSGSAVAEYLARRASDGDHVSVTVVDAASNAALRTERDRLVALGCAVTLGTESVPADTDLVVASPGLPPSSALLRSARERSVPVISEIEFAYRISSSPWVAVTGTNGKTTTTALISHLLNHAGIPAESVGNIGRAATRVASEAGPAAVLVAEVSSFQLALIDRFRPRVSVLLNITPDHVDWHGSLERYEADKVRVFANQAAGDVAVIDVDDDGSRPYAESVAARSVEVYRVSTTAANVPGAYLDGTTLVIATGAEPIPLVDRSELAIHGEHNVSNALAAAAAAYAAGASVESIREGLKTFRPIEHRLEPAGVAGGVEFVNDSKATNPDAVLKALTAFEDRHVIVLLGGYDKGNDFGPLVREISARGTAAVLFGAAAPRIKAVFDAHASGPEVPVTVSMAEALALAAGAARPGDVVLLSPACASFDEFDDYEHRGRVFKDLVHALP
ncbi:MAG TPA: UDP-N-acetylmuramoyl-L-alanine--D-glutamate ligase, partial [Coriobacteriia bacterium]|nr:UDP-N-acetylmuramoyl-L-alanine--D-glutamate ligase [Coriobacteriia bacterium]